MLKELTVIVIVAIFQIVDCDDRYLPQVLIPDRGVKLLLPHNPPRPPLLRLVGQKFCLPQCCQNASEWEDIDLSLQILCDYTEPDPERSSFASLINLIKFILIKEELSCIDAIKGPIVQVQRPEGKIFKDKDQILNDIETALANKPKQRASPIEYYDNVDISNMIPIWRPRGNCRKKILTTTPRVKEISNCTCDGQNVLQNLGSLAVIGSNLSPVVKGSKACKCSKCPMIAMKNPNRKLQSLPATNVKPVVIGCSGNCNLCQKLGSPLASASIVSGCPTLARTSILSGCPKLARVPVMPGCPELAPMLFMPGCPKANMLGCPCSGLGCSKCSNMLASGQPKQTLSVFQAESLPLFNPYGNQMKQVTTTVLVPFTVSQLVA